jgi:hypothetical protein
MISIVIDSNVIRDSPYLSRSEWSSLFEKRYEWGVELLVPDVVLMESTKVVPEEWGRQRDALKKVKVGAFGLQDDLNNMVQRIDDQIVGYEQELTSRLSELDIRVLSTPEIPHMEIAYRASRRKAPYHEGDKDGYRDTLIWFTVLEVAKNNPNHEVWLVSNNTKDFGKPGAKQGPDNSDGPIPRPLHPHLEEDLLDQGLHGRVMYATSLRALEHHIAALSGPIPNEALWNLIQATQLDLLLESLNDETSHLVPAKDLALNPRFDYGVIQAFLDVPGTWRFTDAAGRVHGRWTANFSVDVDTEIFPISPDTDDFASVVIKPLRVSGTVAFTENGEPQDLQISGIEALPDDPGREAWALRATAEAARRAVSMPANARDALRQAATGLTISENAHDALRQGASAGLGASHTVAERLHSVNGKNRGTAGKEESGTEKQKPADPPQQSQDDQGVRRGEQDDSKA